MKKLYLITTTNYTFKSYCRTIGIDEIENENKAWLLSENKCSYFPVSEYGIKYAIKLKRKMIL